MKSDVVIRWYKLRVTKTEDDKIKKNTNALPGINISIAAIGYEVRAQDSRRNCRKYAKCTDDPGRRVELQDAAVDMRLIGNKMLSN